ncbi:class I SAM-dependent methyltransferase [Luethyella okanaganae]|uniref:Class I SAM-dependent methyltransferase n=1 Tax=Luethyella okanaganae TaxID=69372 RepID=A0ABW1VDQ4_9MICO
MNPTSQYSSHLFDRDARNNSWSNLLRFIPRGSRVLDVGCSSGNFGEALEQMNECSVVGVDLNPDDIAVARQKISEAHVLDITDDTAPDILGTFDVIVFADVLEHLPDPRAALVKIRSMLRDRGVVVYSIPNMSHASIRLDLLEGRFGYTEVGLLDKTHFHFYDGDEINDVFASAGYRIDAEEPVVSEYPEGMVRERLAKIGLAANAEFFDMLHRTESNIYQYVGVAEPDQAPPSEWRRPVRSTPPDDILTRAREIENECALLRSERDLLRSERDAVRNELDGLVAHIAFVKRHPLTFLFRKITGRPTHG